MTDRSSLPVDSDRPVAAAPTGAFRGVFEHTGRVAAWRGIRYAAAPVGDRRWRDPVPAAVSLGVIDATDFGPASPQSRNAGMNLGPDARTDEDCLFLNVWSPADVTQARPVMVWLHGGAYAYGSGSQPTYESARFAEAGDVVVVTLNYRVGALGFLDLSSFTTAEARFDGNLAMKDVLLALKWVQENIAAFGGDPTRVTVFGESAGGGLVTTLLATPSAAGLFHAAIAQSSPATSVYGAARARDVAERFLVAMGVDEPSGAREWPVADIVAATAEVFAEIPTTTPGTIAFAPVIDGTLIPEAPITVLAEGRGLPVPLLIGTNRDEASLFRYMKSPLMPIDDADIERMFADMRAERPDAVLPPRDQVLAAYEGMRHRAVGLGIARDIAFRLPTVWLAEGHSRVAPVWLYRFDYATPALRLMGIGATHGSELPYVFGNLDGGPQDPTFRLGGRRTAERISPRIMARWAAFAHGGAPDVPDGVAWPPYDTTTRATLRIDATDSVVPDLDQTLRSGWGDAVISFP